MKIIFLDIDGVLNSTSSAIVYNGYNQLDPVSIGLLKELTVRTGAQIVISSTWRFRFNREEFIELFSKYGWKKAPIISMTEKSVPDGVTRGHEIDEWLTRHKEITEFVILDDSTDFLPEQRNNLVLVSNVDGLRFKHMCKALRILGNPDKELEHILERT
jgi:FMN phosphatase YigB (HAD superfamily)